MREKNLNEKFLKYQYFVVDFKLQVPTLMQKVYTYSISTARSWVVIYWHFIKPSSRNIPTLIVDNGHLVGVESIQFFIEPIQCVFVSLSGPAIVLQKIPILTKKKNYFSDEAHFDLGGYVNKQNCRIWGTKNLHAYIEKPMHPKRVTVWCGF